MTAPLLTTACQKDYGQYFDIEWDEEVELHNGRIIIVHVKRTFERVRHMRYYRWRGMREATEISFDAGGQIGFYKKKFIGYDVSSINFNRGTWYIKLRGLDRVLSKRDAREIVKQMIPVWIIESDDTERAAESWSEVPYFTKLNMMRVVPDTESISKFNGKFLTIDFKKAYSIKYPYGKLINVDGRQPQPE